MGLKLWYRSDLFKVTKVGLLIVALFVFASLRQMRYDVTDQTAKRGMKDLLWAQHGELKEIQFLDPKCCDFTGIRENTTVTIWNFSSFFMCIFQLSIQL